MVFSSVHCCCSCIWWFSVCQIAPTFHVLIFFYMILQLLFFSWHCSIKPKYITVHETVFFILNVFHLIVYQYSWSALHLIASFKDCHSHPSNSTFQSTFSLLKLHLLIITSNFFIHKWIYHSHWIIRVYIHYVIL